MKTKRTAMINEFLLWSRFIFATFYHDERNKKAKNGINLSLIHFFFTYVPYTHILYIYDNMMQMVSRAQIKVQNKNIDVI